MKTIVCPRCGRKVLIDPLTGEPVAHGRQGAPKALFGTKDMETMGMLCGGQPNSTKAEFEDTLKKTKGSQS